MAKKTDHVPSLGHVTVVCKLPPCHGLDVFAVDWLRWSVPVNFSRIPPPSTQHRVCVRGWVCGCVGVCVCVGGWVGGWVGGVCMRACVRACPYPTPRLVLSRGGALKARLSGRGSQGAALKAWLSGRGSQGAALKAWLSRRGSQGAALRARLSGRGSRGVALKAWPLVDLRSGGPLKGAASLRQEGVGLRRCGPTPTSSSTPAPSPTPAPSSTPPSPTLSEGVVHQGVAVALVPHPPQRVARHLPPPPL